MSLKTNFDVLGAPKLIFYICLISPILWTLFTSELNPLFLNDFCMTLSFLCPFWYLHEKSFQNVPKIIDMGKRSRNWVKIIIYHILLDLFHFQHYFSLNCSMMSKFFFYFFMCAWKVLPKYVCKALLVFGKWCPKTMIKELMLFISFPLSTLFTFNANPQFHNHFCMNIHSYIIIGICIKGAFRISIYKGFQYLKWVPTCRLKWFS